MPVPLFNNVETEELDIELAAKSALF